MAFTRPVKGMEILAEDFGQPVYDWIAANTAGGWNNLTLAANWTNYQGFTACQIRKRGTQIVELRGVAQRKNGTLPAGTTADLATLPAGYFPMAPILVPCISGFATPDICRMDLTPAGKITVQPRIEIGIDGYVGFSGVYWID